MQKNSKDKSENNANITTIKPVFPKISYRTELKIKLKANLTTVVTDRISDIPRFPCKYISFNLPL